MASQTPSRLAVVLIGHGSPATDCPRQLVGELMSLEWRQNHAANPQALRQRAAELDATIRDWPRRPDNDPYKAGLERLAEALRPLLPTDLFVIGYGEFCRPSIEEAIEQVIAKGASRVLVVPSMLTPGGLHSELDIPQELAGIRTQHPHVRIDYVWPFDLPRVAGMLAAQIQEAAESRPPTP